MTNPSPDTITQKYLRRWPSSKEARSWAGRMVHIQTENGVWRKGGCGYTWAGKPDAWVLPFEDAVKQVAHCGPEKMARFIDASSSMTSPDTSATEVVGRLRHLISLNEPRNGGPYAGIAAEACMKAMADAITTIDTSRAETAAAKQERDEANARADAAEETADDAAYQDGYEEGKSEWRGVKAQLWNAMQQWLTLRHGLVDTTGEGYTVNDILNGLAEVEAENKRLLLAARRVRPSPVDEARDGVLEEAAYEIERHDQDDGSISYEVWQHKPEHRHVLTLNDDPECAGRHAREDANRIVTALLSAQGA